MEAIIFTGTRRNQETTWTRTRGTLLTVHRSPVTDLSNWFFYCQGLRKVFLKTGWNVFGRNSRNDFEIHSVLLKSCDFCIFVSTTDNVPPLVYALHDLVVDGRKITGRDDARPIKPLTKMCIVRGNKIMVFLLRQAVSRRG